MSMIAVCDGCGRQEPAWSNGGQWFKPHLWFERTPDGEQPITACSRTCIKAIEAKRESEGKQPSTVVLPI